MAQITLLKASALQFLQDQISSFVDLLSGEANARIAGLSRAGVIPINVTGTTIDNVANETTLSATIDLVLAGQGVVITGGSSVELILPTEPITTTGTIYLHVDGDERRIIMDEQNILPAPVDQIGTRRGLILKRRGGNWAIQNGASNGQLNLETSERRAMDNSVGLIPLVDAVSIVAPDQSSTVIAAEINPSVADQGGAIIGGSTVRIVLPNPLTGLLSMHVVGDVEARIMNERNNVQLTGDDLTAGAGIFLDRRGGNWVVVSGAVGTDEFNDLASRNLNLARDGAIIPTEIVAGSTGDIIILKSAASFTDNGIVITDQTKFTKYEYRPAATNLSDNPTVTMDGFGPYSIRDQDGNVWPAEGFIPNRFYILHRIGQQVWVMFSSGDGNGHAAINVNPLNTDAGLKIEDLQGKVTFRHDEDGTFLAGVEGSIENILTKLAVRPVGPTVRVDELDLSAAYELTAESQVAVNKGIMARGGRAAPMPTFCMPQPGDWGKNWLANVQIPITPTSPRIITDPIYQRNVGFDEFVHPHVMHFPHGWMGYEYILCMNPYAGGAPGGSEVLENPAIYGAHDMKGPWKPFRHFENPLADSTNFVMSRSFLSDNVWFYDPLTGEILCIYRRFNVTIGRMYFEYRATTDGVHWTPIRSILEYASADETVGEWVSPMIAYNPTDGLYYMIVGQNYNFYLRTKKNLRNLDEPWSAPINIQVPGWHGEIRVIGNRLYLFTCDTNHAPAFKVHRSLPGDWTTYELVRENFIDNSAFIAEYGGALTYKNTLVPHLYDDGTAQLKCLVTCRPNSSTWWLWYGETPRQPIVDL